MRSMPMSSTPMYPDKAIVDLRVYTIRLRKMAEFIDVFDRLAMLWLW